ncbi:hypothetical protein D3C77_567700 [compost metagenome]
MSARRVCSFCALSASMAGSSNFTERLPAAVLVTSASPPAAWVIARLIITSPRTQSTSSQSSATSSLVRSPVQIANCTIFLACPLKAARIACCSSGVNGSTSSSLGGASFLEYVHPASGFKSSSSSSTASFRADRRQLWILLSVLLLTCNLSSQPRITFRFKSTNRW